jgi:hypothetical protein
MHLLPGHQDEAPPVALARGSRIASGSAVL